MSDSRIYQSGDLKTQRILPLDAPASHHLGRVLRAGIGDQLTIFNGEGGEYAATIIEIDKKRVIVELGKFDPREAESPLSLVLAQGISRGEKMDYTMQKAVELGVSEVIPLFTERCTVKLDEERRLKKQQHWESIIISATEQCGRNRLAKLHPAQALKSWLQTNTSQHAFVLAPGATQKLDKITIKNKEKIVLLIGPEGGLSEPEIAAAISNGFQPLNLGPRILRTETAAVAALAVLQCIYGDLAK